MKTQSTLSAIILGLCILTGLFLLAYVGGKTALQIKAFERSVTVKGLSEREVASDIIVWPIEFLAADNDLQTLYKSVDNTTEKITKFLTANGIAKNDISASSPAVTDKSAKNWGSGQRAQFRYSASTSVTVYSSEMEKVRSIMNTLSELGREGIVFTAGNYQYSTEYIFSGLNELKPEMIEEATKNARNVAEKFAEDSNSTLGKIKRASQGRFSISARDRNNPHIKKVRVVSTVEYYLTD